MLRLAPALIAVCLVLSGCAHEAAARKPGATFKFEPAPGNGLIVLYRNTAGYMGMGATVNSTVTIDNKALGDLTQDRYAVIGVGPGEHLVNLMGAVGVSNLMLQVAPGEVHFVQVIAWPTLGSTQTDRETAMRDLDNDGEPLTLGFKYSFGAAAPAAGAPATTQM